jgi:hypothetical protein
MGMTTASRERDRASFRDLAKLANMTPPPSGPVSGVTSSEKPTSTTSEKKEREENSGVINLAVLAASEEAKSTATPAIVAPTLRSSGTPAKLTPAQSAPQTTSSRKGRAWVTISSLVAVAAVAAGVFFGVHHAPETRAPGAIAQATPPIVPAAAPTSAPTTRAAAATPIAPADRGVDPSSLPAVATTSSPSTPAATQAAVALRAPAKPGAAAGAPTTDPALVASIPTAHAAPAGSGADLQTLMQQAAGVTSSPTAPAATGTDSPTTPPPGSVPLKPSQGAIQGALGAALPAARACLGPDDPISHATITFGSDGSVTNVGVSGGAAGKPAEACIRNALKRARVMPFAQPTFTATATVRPN